MTLYDKEAEQTVLGSILQSPDIFTEASQLLRGDDFYFEPNRIIYQTISDLYDKQNSVDIMLLISTLKDKDLLDKTGNRSAIMEMASLGSPIAALSFANKVKELALRRQLLTQIKEIEQAIQDRQHELNEILSKTEKSISAIADRQTGYNVQHVQEIKNEFLEFIENLEKSKNGITGVSTGFDKLDQLTSGLKGGQLIVLAARPGAGKTTLGLNIAQNIAVKSQKPVLIFSLEMTRLELLLRMVCADAYLDSSKIQKGFISNVEVKKITQSVLRLNESDLYLDDSPDLSAWEFRQRCRRLAGILRSQKKEIGLVVVDYLQLMSDKGRGNESRQLEVANISRSLKIIAKELNTPVIAISQMNRSIEQRGKDPRPQLSDLRESGAIEQDADIVMFIHREDMFNYDLPPELAGQADIIIAKHRAGPTGTVKLAFIKEKNLFMDLEVRDDSDSMEPQPNPF